MNWVDSSEITAGLVISGRAKARPDLFIPPYNTLVSLYLSGITKPEDLIEKVGLSPVQAAFDAVHSMNGMGDKDWVRILETSKLKYDAGTKFEKFGKRMQDGDDVDLAQLTYYMKAFQHGDAAIFTPLSQIESSNVPYMRTGWPPVDKELWGIPTVGFLIIAGPSGSGKTWLFTKISSRFATTYPDKNVAFFSLEMIKEEIKARYKVENLPKDVEDRILVCPHPLSVEDVINYASNIQNLGMVGIDFADLLVKGETTAGSMENIYKTLMLGAKELGCPVILLAQLSNYSGGLPRPNMLRWTRLAECLGWSVWMTYNPTRDWYQDNQAQESGLPLMANTAFICAWKMRGGFYYDKDGERTFRDDAPGALQIPFKPDMGWGNKSRWFSLAKETE